MSDVQEALVRFEAETRRKPSGLRMSKVTGDALARTMGFHEHAPVQLFGIKVTIDDTVVPGDFVFEGREGQPLKDPLDLP